MTPLNLFSSLNKNSYVKWKFGISSSTVSSSITFFFPLVLTFGGENNVSSFSATGFSVGLTSGIDFGTEVDPESAPLFDRLLADRLIIVGSVTLQNNKLL